MRGLRALLSSPLMFAFLVKRLANAAGVMLAVAFIAFMIFRFVGDPVELL